MIVIILNGFPGSGKDEFMEIARKQFRCYQHSTIDICKEVCEHLGWEGEKDDNHRAMLVDLKKWYIKYFDGPFKDFKQEIEWVTTDLVSSNDFFFVVTRESNEISRMKYWLNENGYKCVYLFMDRGTERDFGNNSDNNVLQGIKPDIVIDNKGDLEELEKTVNVLLSGLLSNKDVANS